MLTGTPLSISAIGLRQVQTALIQKGHKEIAADGKWSDAVAAAAFWRLVKHLQHRTDAQNVDLMGLAGFCRNCLSKWMEEAAATSGEELPADGTVIEVLDRPPRLD